MNHEMSVTTQAAERYLLGELPPADREAFEQHFFECPACAEEVRLAFAFADNSKAVLPGIPEPASPRNRRLEGGWWLAWLRPMTAAPLAAALALAVLAGYQNAVLIPGLRSAQVLPSAVLVPATRGSLPSVSAPPEARFFQLTLEVVAPGTFEKYECELRASSGRSVAKLAVSSIEPGGSLHLLVPSSGFGAGTHEAVLYGISAGKSTEIERYRFTVKRD